MRGLRDREILLRPEAEPVVRQHARAHAARDFYGIIAAAGIDHDRLGGERGRGETILELRASVAGDHHECERKRLGHRVKRGRAR